MYSVLCTWISLDGKENGTTMDFSIDDLGTARRRADSYGIKDVPLSSERYGSVEVIFFWVFDMTQSKAVYKARPFRP